MPPARRCGSSFDALIADLRSQSRRPNARASRIGVLAQGKAGVGQRLILGAGRPDAETGDDPRWIDRHGEMEAFIPAEAVPPAAVHEARPPASATTLGIPRRHRGALEGFVEDMAAAPEVYPGEAACDKAGVVSTPQAVDRRAIGPSGKGGAEGWWRIAIARPFAGAAGPLAQEVERDDLTAAARGPRTGVHFRR